MRLTDICYCLNNVTLKSHSIHSPSAINNVTIYSAPKMYRFIIVIYHVFNSLTNYMYEFIVVNCFFRIYIRYIEAPLLLNSILNKNLQCSLYYLRRIFQKLQTF